MLFKCVSHVKRGEARWVIKNLQVKEGELARRATKFIHKSASKVAAEDSTEIVIRDLRGG
jgi:hypothetical protein